MSIVRAVEPRYALFGSVNKEAVGSWPHSGQIISMHATVEQAQARAAYGDVYGRRLRWYAVVDREGGDVVAREDW